MSGCGESSSVVGGALRPHADGGLASPDVGASPDAGPSPDVGAPAEAGVDAGRSCATEPRPVTGFTPVPVAVAVAKVKNLLVGLGPADEEVAAVEADPAALDGLIVRWMALPLYEDKMRRFFTSAFQQDQFTYDQLVFQFMQYYAFEARRHELIENFQQVFGRTAMQLVAEGRPFTEVMTTTRFMMTPAMMASYAILDNIVVDDRQNRTALYQLERPSSLTLQSARAIPFADSIDPASPDFMVFQLPGLAGAPNCPDPLVYPSPIAYEDIADLLYGVSPRRVGTCMPPALPVAGRFVADTDFTAWRMVTVRTPRAGEATTPLYDLPSMRAGRDLVLHTPRVSFFTTPAFSMRWPTNNSNLDRVRINQTMIVALGRPIDLGNEAEPADLSAVDHDHAPAGSTCFGCHRALDPMAQFFRHTYTLFGSPQRDLRELSWTGQFAFHGVTAPGDTIHDLGAQLAAHPLLAAAWTQKLCTYATSAPCDEADPEFVRLVGVFRDSRYSWSALVRALFASPLVTHLAPTRSAAAAGQPVAVARQEHLCATLSARLGLSDVCGRDFTDGAAASPVARALAGSWPSGQYSRGSAQPALGNAPSPFVRGGLENICADLAPRVVRWGPSAVFSTSDPTAAVHLMATRLMGLTGPRVAAPEAILREHYDAARAEGAEVGAALQSTFVLACTSAYVAGVGN